MEAVRPGPKAERSGAWRAQCTQIRRTLEEGELGELLFPQALHPSSHMTRGGFGLYCTVYISAIFGIHTGPTCSLDYLLLMHLWSHLDPVWIEMQLSDP